MKPMHFALIAVMLLIFPLASANGDVSFGLNQTDYYFKIGQEAVLPLTTENTYPKSISGVLTSSITQEINQGNFQYSSSNSQSAGMTIEEGHNTVAISFGTSSSPVLLKVGLKFNYNDGDEQRIVNLDDINIHFISNQTQAQNKQNPVESSSQQYTQTQPKNPFSQQDNLLQQMMNQMSGNQQADKSTQDRLQNNQMSQDSSALKKQMENQLQEQQQLKQQFQKELQKNSELMSQHQQLMGQGFNLTGGNLNPTNNNSGTFRLDYNNQQNETASLQGSMENGELRNLQKDSPQIRQELMDKLQSNPKFQQYQQQLQSEGFTPQNTRFSQTCNSTHVQLNYQNIDNQNASIDAEFNNTNLMHVELTDNFHKKKISWWIFTLLFVIAALISFACFWWKRRAVEKTRTSEKPKEKPFDFRAESLAMLERSKLLFDKHEFKDAYMLAGQALRLFLSYKNNLKKEITNDEIIKYLRQHNKPYKEAKKCFDLCSLVEFAKYKANKKDFNNITDFALRIISMAK